MRDITKYFGVLAILAGAVVNGATIGGIQGPIEGGFPGFGSFGVHGTLTGVYWDASAIGSLDLLVGNYSNHWITVTADASWQLSAGPHRELWLGTLSLSCDVSVPPYEEHECMTFREFSDGGFITDPHDLDLFRGMGVQFNLDGDAWSDEPPNAFANVTYEISGQLDLTYEYQPVAAIPEPATALLVFCGGLGLLAGRALGRRI